MRATLLLLLLLGAWVSPADAADQLLAGTALRIAQRQEAELRALSRDPAIRRPATIEGATLRITTAAGFDRTWELPAGDWTSLGPGGWRFRNRDFRAVVIQDGRLLVVSRRLPIDVRDAPGPVHVVLRAGDERYCLTFGGRATHRPGRRFRAVDAPAPTTCGPLGVDAGADRTVAACAAVAVDATVDGAPDTVRWELLERTPPVTLEQAGATVRLRAPAVAVATPLTLRVIAERGGTEVSDTTTLTVEPSPPEEGLAAGTTPDCAPFRHGVASGDPLPDGVVLWTRVTPESGTDNVTVAWQVARDPAFEMVAASGSTETNAERDFTVKVDVRGLQPATTYWYRFGAPDGRWSSPGRTRTAPGDAAERLRMAVASCSSLYSGWFNAYRRIGERDDLDLVIHLGDYIYDFVDEDEQVRLPIPFPTQPDDLTAWRARHAEYLLDPDLRLARAMHPWAVIWDNHDVEADAPPAYEGSVQAFREWIPVRDTAPLRPELIYRSLQFGPLADVVLLDTLLHRNRDPVPGTTEFSILGTEQFDWLTGTLRASRPAWRILGSQRLLATARVNPDFVEVYDGERREVFDPRTWDGFPADRTRLFQFLAAEGIDDTVAVSGDSHISAALDLVDDPANPAHPYDPATSDAPVGVELLPTSISRGNFDEALGLTLPPGVYDVLVADTLARNPHGRYLELTRHGYGLLDLTADRVVAEIWYSPILARADAEELGVQLTVRRGRNRWERP